MGPESVSELAAAFSDVPADNILEVFRRCEAADALGALGPVATPGVPALIRTLTVIVRVDCVQVLRVAVARALWRIERRADLALPHLTRALEDDYWGVARTAVETLSDMGEMAQPAASDLIALAKRRLASGPLYFEEWLEDGPEQPAPLLAAIAAALRRCAAEYPETQTLLAQIARDPDERVRAAVG